MKAATGAGRAAALLAVVVILTRPAFSQSSVALSETQFKAELRAVLLEARAAVIEVVAHDPSSSDPRLSQDIQDLIDLSRGLDDPGFVRYLQQHLKEEYAAEIRHALDPAETRQDFTRRIAALATTDNAEHDDALELIVTQQLERSMYSDAVDTAGQLHSPAGRDRLRRQIAITGFKNNERAWVARAIDDLILSAVEPHEWGPVSWHAASELARFALELHEAGDVDDAKRVLLGAQLIATPSKDKYAYQALALAAAGIGDTRMALELLAQLEDKGLRRSVEDALTAELAQRVVGQHGRHVAATIADDSSRSKAFVVIGQREAAAGRQDNAAAAFDLARQAAHKDEEYAVFDLVDIAKAQIALGDRASANSTLSEALAENEKFRWGGDQLRGWSYLAAVVASMGDFARAQAIAARIDEHSFRAHALRAIADYQTIAEHLTDAKSWAGRLREPNERGGAFLGIAEAMVDQRKKPER